MVHLRNFEAIQANQQPKIQERKFVRYDGKQKQNMEKISHGNDFPYISRDVELLIGESSSRGRGRRGRGGRSNLDRGSSLRIAAALDYHVLV